MNIQQPKDTWNFTGAKATYTTLDNAAAVDAGVNPADPREHLVTIPSTAHGFLASSGDLISCLFILGSVNYNGLRKIHAVATNTITIVAPYVAETFAGTETIKSMISFNHAVDFLGFRIHLSAASATSENLTVDIDSNKGSAFDTNVYTKDMNTIQNITNMFSESIPLAPDDRVNVAWANSNSRTFGIDLFTRRR